MASNYTAISASAARVDLDALFKARTGTAISLVGFKVATVDMSDRYEGSTGASDRIQFDINYKSASIDLSQLFQDLNFSAVTPTPTPTITATPSATVPEPTETLTPTPTETEASTPTPTPTESQPETPTPTPTETPTETPTPTPTLTASEPLDVLPTYATFDSVSGLTYTAGDSLSVTHTGNDGTDPVTLLFYYWNGTGYVSSGDTGSTHQLGDNPYQGTPDDLTGGLFRYYYTLKLTNGAGSTDPDDEANFGWNVLIQF